MTARRVLVVVLLALGLVGASCGVPLDSAAHALSAKRVDERVLKSPPTPTTAPAGKPLPGDKKEQIYFLSDGYLVPVARYVTASGASDEVNEALDFLNAGPDAAEADRGITTALSQTSTDQVQLESLNTKAGLATVELSEEFASPALLGSELYRAFGQIVYTVTGFPDITKVNFVLDGQPWPAFLPNGRIATGPVRRAQYASVLAS